MTGIHPEHALGILICIPCPHHFAFTVLLNLYANKKRIDQVLSRDCEYHDRPFSVSDITSDQIERS